MDVRVILQARTSSDRLPAKSLLPIGGMPLVVLAARRAEQSGYPVTVATSNDPTDDALTAMVASCGFSVVRGSMQDVVQRFMQASADLPDASLVVRLTADNFLPDGDFIRQLVDFAARRQADIAGTRWPESGLPYGMSAEVFRVSALRSAARANLSDFDREHVSPWIWQHCRTAVLDDYREMNIAHLRCTVDTLDDYLRMQRVVDGLSNVAEVPWRELVERLHALPDAPTGLFPRRARRGSSQSILVVGTAQLGMSYGVLRKTPMLSEAAAVALVRRAVDYGVTQFDTARAYAASEERLGMALSGDWSDRATVLTKLDPLTDIPPDAPDWSIRAAVRASVFASCRGLGLRRLPVLMLHRARHKTDWDGRVWGALLELRAEGVVEKLGVSFQSPAEAPAFIHDPDVQHIQLPFNILDGRWRAARIPELLAERDDIVVHARSVFLQGVMLQNHPSSWPRQVEHNSQEIIDWLRLQSPRMGRDNLTDLCLAYVRAQTWIDGIVIGMENENHLVDNVRLFDRPPLTPEQCIGLDEQRPRIGARLLDPSQWIEQA
jgi:spore coat polysaccharide biosynthesis protein SpsF (cytidylyltransferase family)/aryl-alcohol dehydrogenase-like predicted oxidoreductase